MKIGPVDREIIDLQEIIKKEINFTSKTYSPSASMPSGLKSKFGLYVALQITGVKLNATETPRFHVHQICAYAEQCH